jgi:hypothetical protein
MSPAGPPGASGTRYVDVGNMRYRGEVIIAEAFQPQHGEPLPADLDFRLVFFTLPRRISRDHIRDRRIAMASPTRPPDTKRQGLAAELTAIRETRVRYNSNSTPQTAALSAPMAEHERRLAAVAAGRVLDQHDEPGLTKFLQLVQAGDAAKVANLLDDEVAEFLREFVGTERA